MYKLGTRRIRTAPCIQDPFYFLFFSKPLLGAVKKKSRRHVPLKIWLQEVLVAMELVRCLLPCSINFISFARSLAHSLYKKYATAPINAARMPFFALPTAIAAAAFPVCWDAAEEEEEEEEEAAVCVPVARVDAPDTEAAGGVVGFGTPEGQCQWSP